MKNLITAFWAGLMMTCLPAALDANPQPNAWMIQQNAELSPRVVNDILEQVCKDWALTLTEAWDEYNDGDLTITKTEIANSYYVQYGGDGILISIIEDL